MTYHRGAGRGAYWFMGGPGVDPHDNGTQAEAIAWGAQQAARALADIASGGGIRGACAQFFGGVTRSSSNALMWQWSGGGGVVNHFNGSFNGDLDQIDGARHP